MKRPPLVRQHDSMQCGAACLVSICSYYGMQVPLHRAEELCGGSRRGVSLYGLSEAATSLGFRTQAGKFDMNLLKRLILPCILHWDSNHFVILYKVAKGKFSIADPGKGYITYTEDEFRQHWLTINSGGFERGVALMLSPDTTLISKDPSIKHHHSLSRLFRHFSKYRYNLTQVLVILILSCIFQLIMPFLAQSIVDVGISKREINIIWLILVGEFTIITAQTVTDFCRRWLLMHISMRVNLSLVSDFLAKLLRMPMRFFDVKLVGDILQRIGDHSRVQSFLTGQTLNFLFSIVSILIFGVILFVFDHWIFLIFLIWSIIVCGWISIFLHRRKILDYEVFDRQGLNQDITFEFISNLQEIKLQDCSQRKRWEWEDSQASLFHTRMKAMKLQQTQEGGSIFINELKNIVITVISAQAVINGNISLGAMLAIQYIIGQLNSPVESLMSFIYSLQDVKISLDRINEIHDIEDEERKDTKPINPDDIYIKDVDFKYDNNSRNKALDNVNIKIHHGKINAIVGASGSGKTTLVKLLLAYYKPTAGEIKIGDTDLQEISVKEWRKRCGVVVQDGVIFSDTIARNIASADGDIDIDRLIYAAETANILDFILSLPMKFDTFIGRRGVGLSQGQKQRILIARAVYRNPEYIFFDEATNSLDTRNEREIVDKLRSFYSGKTVVIVAHRLSTVKEADNIIVLDHGTVVEQGSHNELVAKTGTYYQLIRNQLELGN